MSVGRHTGYNLVGALIPLALSFVTVPVYLNLIGSERYGVLAIAWLLLGYFGLFDLGLGRATSFRIAALRDASPRDRAMTFWSALSVNVGMGIVGGALLWVSSQYFFVHMFKVDERIRPEILLCVPLLAASVPIATVTGVLTGALQGRERFLEVNMVSVVSTALFQLGPLALAAAVGPNLLPLLGSAVAARFLAVLALAWQCYRELLRGHPVRAERAEIATLLKYGGWVSVAAMVVPFASYIDRFVIGAILGAASVTSYAIPTQLANRLSVLPNALTTALFPRLSGVSSEERLAMSERATLAMAGLLTAPFIGVIFIIGPFVAVWAGKHLGPEAGLIGRITVPAMWANALGMVSYTRLQSSGRPDLVTKMLILEVPFYLALLYFGTKYFGLTGAAMVMAFRFVADAVLMTIMAGPPTRRWQIIAAHAGLLVIAVWWASLWPITDWRWWVGAAVLGGAASGLALRTVPKDILDSLIGRARALMLRFT